MWAAVGRLAVALTALGLNVLVARILDPVDAGTFFLAQSAITFGVLIAQSGLHRVVTRFVAQSLAEGKPGRAGAAIRTVLRSGSVVSVALAGLCALPPVARTVGSVFEGTRLGDVLWIVGIGLVFRALTVLRAESFRGLQEMGPATIFGGVDAGILALLVLVAVRLFAPSFGTLHVVIAVSALAWAPSLAVSSLMLRRRTATLEGKDRVSYPEVFTVAWPLFVASIGLFGAAQADLWVVGAGLTGSDVALYGAAARLTGVVTTPLVVMNAVVAPIISELYTSGDRARLQRVLRTTATVAGLPSAAVLLAFVFAGGPIMRIVFGDFYARGGAVLALLSLGGLVSVWTGSCVLALTMTRHERTNMVLSLPPVVILPAVALTVVGPFGAVAVAAASSAVLASRNVATWLAARKLLGVYTHAGVGPALAILRSLGTGRGLRQRLLGDP